VALTDVTQAVTDAYAYDPFGNVADQFGTTPNPFKYVGQFGVQAAPAELQYMRARYYMPEIGRFLSRDRVWGTTIQSQFLNLFAYTQNNPINLIDPDGLESGTLTIFSTGEPRFLNQGHSLLSFTSVSGDRTTYATWPYGIPTSGKLEIGKEEDKAYDLSSVASRTVWLDDDNKFKTLTSYYKNLGPYAWTPTYPCSAFAADVWNKTTGENLEDVGYFNLNSPVANPFGPIYFTLLILSQKISNPATLKTSILEKNKTFGNITYTKVKNWETSSDYIIKEFWKAYIIKQKRRRDRRPDNVSYEAYKKAHRAAVFEKYIKYGIPIIY
jgi:RHS repeat-associated protein